MGTAEFEAGCREGLVEGIVGMEIFARLHQGWSRRRYGVGIRWRCIRSVAARSDEEE